MPDTTLYIYIYIYITHTLLSEFQQASDGMKLINETKNENLPGMSTGGSYIYIYMISEPPWGVIPSTTRILSVSV